MIDIQAPASGKQTLAFSSIPRWDARWKPLLVFLLFALVISLAGALVFQRYKESIKRDKQEELAGIAELKIHQITNWAQERRGDAQALSNDPILLPIIEINQLVH